jgi:hypothetical protein
MVSNYDQKANFFVFIISLKISLLKVSIFFENKKVRQIFRFWYKIAKTSKSWNALTSLNTWIWNLKFLLWAQNESYFILFFFYFWIHYQGITLTTNVWLKWKILLDPGKWHIFWRLGPYWVQKYPFRQDRWKIRQWWVILSRHLPYMLILHNFFFAKL